MPMPFFHFYPRDWLASSSVDALTLAEKGAYIDLLARMWERSDGRDGCYLPADDAWLARALHVTAREWKALRAVLIDGPSAVFTVVNGRLINKRLQMEWEKAKAKSAKASTSADARWSASKQDADAMPTHSDRNTNGMPPTEADADAEQDANASLSATVAADPPRPAPKRRNPTDARVRPVIDRFAALHREQVGSPYVVVGKRDGERIRSLPREIEADKLLGYVDAFFALAETDPFLRGKGLTIPMFVSMIPTLQRQEAGANGVAGGRLGSRPVARPVQFTEGLYRPG